MKKILALTSLLIFAAACAAPSTNRDAASNANTSPAMETTSTAPLSEADAIAKEKAVWATLEKKDYEAFGKMLASEYLEVGDDGAYDKAGIVAYLKDLTLAETTFSDWKVTPIDKDAVLLRYSVTIKGTFKGQEVPPGPYRAVSVWITRGGKWVATFYQETPAKAATPMPPAASAPTANGGVRPVAKTAEVTTGPDPVANEKMVWNALKRKDYDAFATMLDSAQIEVEADGVYDKAGTVKGVSTFDASKVELSDWKTVKFDDDASLVTYLVKFPGAKPAEERHSTIWVKRGEKWLALFHQGTPAMTANEAKPAAAKAASPKPSAK